MNTDRLVAVEDNTDRFFKNSGLVPVFIGLVSLIALEALWAPLG
jgi:hypothetical protein